MIPVEVIKKLVPKSQSAFITQEFLDTIENSAKDTEIANVFKDNIISYIDVLNQGKYSLEQYVSAVKYVSYKLLDYSNTNAYIATFPDRCRKLNEKNIGTSASMYNKTKLVNQIYAQTIIPSYILNAPLHQKAINTLVAVIEDTNARPATKVKACEVLLANTKPPESIEANFFLHENEKNNGLEELNNALHSLAKTQKELLEAKEIQLSELITNTKNNINVIDIYETES